MRSFNLGNFGRGADPWFRIGTFDVTTTAALCAIGVISMFIGAIEGSNGPLLAGLEFFSDKVLSGQIWRVFTWPLPNRPDFWTLITIAIMFVLGSQLEASMGRQKFFALVVGMTVIPAVFTTILDVLGLDPAYAGGLRLLELGVLCAFAAAYPTAKFFFGIPAWVLAAVIVVIEVLSLSSFRVFSAIVFLLSVVFVALVGLRSMGFADEVSWIPKVPLPAPLGDSSPSGPARSPKGRSGRATRTKTRKNPPLRAVPPAGPSPTTRLNDQEIDALLDQVSADGIDSLTKDQRRRLEQHSKRLRDEK